MLVNIAREYVLSGLSVIPTYAGTKKPGIIDENLDDKKKYKWGAYKKRVPNGEEIERWFGNNGYSIATIAGKVSQNLEVLDFDCKGEVYRDWAKIIISKKKELFKSLVIEKSQSGGYHVFYRCQETPIPGNTKLAKKRIKVEGEGYFDYKEKKLQAKLIDGVWYIFPDLIESKGEGGYVLVDPSQGYKCIQNDLTQIPTISQTDRDFLIKTALRFDENVPKPPKIPEKKYSADYQNSETPWDKFNSEAGPDTILDLLLSDGWQTTGKNGVTPSGGKTIYLSRPGKNPRKGHSGSIIEGNIFYCYTTNAHPFEGEVSYSPFGVYAMTKFNGDYSQAAKSLWAENRNNSSSSSTKTPKQPLSRPGDFIVIPLNEFQNDNFFADAQTRNKFINHIQKRYAGSQKAGASPPPKYGQVSVKVKDYVEESHGAFTVKDLYSELSLKTDSEKTAARRAIKRLLDKEIVERIGTKNGVYRKIETDLDELDLLNAPSGKTNIWLPLDVASMVDIYPGNIILISGERNVGKTTLNMITAVNNLDIFNQVHYFNSETGATQFRNKLIKMRDKNNDPVEIEKIIGNGFKVYNRSTDFPDVIQPGKGNLNIVDWIEIPDDFWKMAGILAAIHKKLDGAIAIVNVQKNTGTDVGQGGEGNFNKPTLAINLYRKFYSSGKSYGKMKIVKAKEWSGSDSPEFKCINFRLENGCEIRYDGQWDYERDNRGNIIAGLSK